MVCDNGANYELFIKFTVAVDTGFPKSEFLLEILHWRISSFNLYSNFYEVLSIRYPYFTEHEVTCPRQHNTKAKIQNQPGSRVLTWL